MKTPLSIQLYTVREITKTPADFANVVRQIADIGYAGIETGGTGGLSDRDFKKLIDDTGLKVSGWWAMPDKGNINELVDRAKTYGFDCYISCVGGEHFKEKASILTTAAQYQEGAALLAEHGLNLLYHNHWWEFEVSFDGKYGWDILFENAPALKCELDMYWASNFGQVDVPAVIRKYAARTPLYHVKDGSLVQNQPQSAVGKGKHDLKRCIGAIDPKVTQWLVVELDDYVEGHPMMMNAVRDSYGYLTGQSLAKGNK